MAEKKSKMYCHHNINMHNILYISELLELQQIIFRVQSIHGLREFAKYIANWMEPYYSRRLPPMGMLVAEVNN